jgi:HEAT repeat protein
VIRDLESPDEEVRRLAVERVAALPLHQTVSCLIERLGDESWRVRKAAVERLVACPDSSEAAEGLIGALADGENPGRRNAAVEALVRSGARVVDRLMVATTSEDPDVRKLVVDALAGIREPRSLPRLLERFADDDPNVRAAAADALGAIGGPVVESTLRRSAVDESEDQLVRFSALRGLALLDVPVPARELGPVLANPVLGPAGLALLGQGDDPDALPVLLKALVTSGPSGRTAAMRSVLRMLSGMDGERADALAARVRETAEAHPDLIPACIEGLDDSDLGTRLVLIQFLGLVQAAAASVPILLAGRDEALAEVARATLESLGADAEQAIDIVWEDLDEDTQRDACALFGSTQGGRGAARLLAALEDPSPYLRTAAARSIGERRLSQGLTLLIHRLELAAAEEDFESEEEVRVLSDALIALAGPSDGGDHSLTEQAVVLLASRVEGAAEGMRLAIVRVLGCIGRRQDAPIVTLLLKDHAASVRHGAVVALARLDPGTHAEPLRLALADESPAVRIAAAGALGASESEEVIGDLCHLADDEDPLVRAAAVRAIGIRFTRSEVESTRSRARELLQRACADEAPVALAVAEAVREVGADAAHLAAGLLDRPEPEVVRGAVHGLGLHAEADALEALLPMISHPDWSVRAEAIQVVSDRGFLRAIPAILRRLETEQDEFVRDAILRALKRLEG